MKPHARWLLLPLCLVALSAASCSAFETNLQDTEVDYLETARQNYEKGQDAMEAETFNEAIKFFEYVKNKYPYSKYAVLADLRIADAHFGREKWLEAADSYRLFVRFHPSNENVPYATYRVALSYYNETSVEPWFDNPLWTGFVDVMNPFPPAKERDQTATKDAIRAFDEYLLRFPDHENVEEAKVFRIKARTQLAKHDLYAAQFYEDRDKWTGAMWRYEKVAADFGDTPLAPGALLRAAELAEDELEDNDAALLTYQRVVDQYPEKPEADAARAAITRLKAAQAAQAKKAAKANKKQAPAPDGPAPEEPGATPEQPPKPPPAAGPSR